MSIFAWILLGLLAGGLAARLMGERQGCLTHVIVGIIGALIGGALFSFIGQQSITGVNLRSIFVALIGSVILIAVFRALRGQDPRKPS